MPSQNGPWVASAGAWYRPASWASGSTQLGGSIIGIGGGTTYGGTSWILNANGITVDTDAETWTQVGASGPSGVTSLNTLTGALTLAAGTGVTLTPSGSTLTIAATGGGGGTSGNYFGTGSDGAVTYSSNTSLTSSTGVNDTGIVVKNYSSLTINSGVVVNAAERAEVMLVYVTGKLHHQRHSFNELARRERRGPRRHNAYQKHSRQHPAFARQRDSRHIQHSVGRSVGRQWRKRRQPRPR